MWAFVGFVPGPFPAELRRPSHDVDAAHSTRHGHNSLKQPQVVKPFEPNLKIICGQRCEFRNSEVGRQI